MSIGSPTRQQSRRIYICDCCKKEIPKNSFYNCYRFNYNNQYYVFRIDDWCNVKYKYVLNNSKNNQEFIDDLTYGFPSFPRHDFPVSVYSNKYNTRITGIVTGIYYDSLGIMKASIKPHNKEKHNISVDIFDSGMRAINKG